MKTILCYGDSNTYGYNPRNTKRYPKEIRWTTILQNELEKDYEIIVEGLNGRTTAFDKEEEDTKNGLTHFKAIFGSHKPVDIIIFMLGTNDCCSDVNASLEEIAKGMEKLILSAREEALKKQEYLPRIILITPSAILDDYKNSRFAYQLNEEAIFKSKHLNKYYQLLALKYDCDYLDCTNMLEVSPIDSEHLTEKGHYKLAKLLKEVILK